MPPPKSSSPLKRRHRFLPWSTIPCIRLNFGCFTMAARMSSQGGPNTSASLRAICLLFPSLSSYTSQTTKQVLSTPQSASMAPRRAYTSHPSTSRCRNPRGFISSKTKSRYIMVKTAGSVLIFFYLYESSPSSLSPPHSSSDKSESLSIPPTHYYRQSRNILSPAPPTSSHSFAATHYSSSYDPTPLILRPTPHPPGGSEGTSVKEANGGREWLSATAMTVDGGVAVGL